jgi:hypothetical protein
MTTTTTSVPELTFQGDTFGKATNDHLREALAEPRFKVRRTETDPYEWLEWVVSPSHPSSGQSCFSVKRVESDGSDGIEQPESSCVPKYANIRPRRIFALFGKSMPEWITQRLTLGDKGVIQAVTNVVDEGFVSISLVRYDQYLDMQVLMRQEASDLVSYEMIYLCRLKPWS